MARQTFTRDQLLLSLQRALVAAIRPNYRFICYRMNSPTEVTLRCYCREEPTEGDRDELDSVATELHADFPSLEHVTLEFIPSDEPVGYLDALDGWVFGRYE
jgi:hypothetical protein